MCMNLEQKIYVQIWLFFYSSTPVVFKPVLQAPLPCTFCMCPLSDTPDSAHQLVSRDCKTWTGCVDKGHIQNVQGRGACRTGLKTTALL